MTKIPLITSYVNGQRLKWFEHVNWKESTNKTKAIIKLQLEGRRPRGKQKKLYINSIQ